MDAFLSIIPSKTFFQNVIPIENTVLPKIISKGKGKAFLVKIENKMLFQNQKDTVNVRPNIQNPHANQVNKVLLYI